ncbi:MAG: bifunctional [glutamate--ammonia ligase]-adenylyl-L-tyrosine phosphorylase/[glutamate--ammonia-ligase] adenylyltransferase [Ghiorsea sp.]
MAPASSDRQVRYRWLRQHSSQFDGLVKHFSSQDVDALLALDTSEGESSLPNQYAPWIPDADESQSLEEAQQALRQAKNRAMPYFLWWELGLQGDIETSAKHLALLASGLLETSLTMAKYLIQPRFGSLEQGKGQFTVIGLGKLGGKELNLGSDVDLLFVWHASAGATTSGGRKQVPASEYYQHLARLLIRLMDERTVHGITWLTDMRLRPNGDGAPLCLSLQATLNHYQDHGQTWERAMLLKAAVVAGSDRLGKALIEGLRPFIWRQYLDYTTVQALSEMKQRIDQQAGDKKIEVGFDVKRGVGGIREIEFMIQSLLLLHAGRNHALYITPSMEALGMLEKFNHINTQDAAVLRQAYRFWRRAEHAIQAQRGQHTHQLADGWQAWLSQALDVEDMSQVMHHQAAQVSELFQRHFAQVAIRLPTQKHWLLQSDAGQFQAHIAQQCAESNGEQQQKMVSALLSIQAQMHRQLLPERCAKQVESATLYFLEHWRGDANVVSALQYWADLLHHIAGRATWIDLLSNDKTALHWLANMLASSGFIAQHIAKNPTWLEWPLHHQHEAEARIQHICQQISELDTHTHDEDVFLANMGRLIDDARLTTAIEIASHDDLSPLVAGRWLSDVADVAVLASMRLAIAQYQLPVDFPLVALAMGKHGSQSMGLVSDLDMVFLLVHPDPFAVGPKGKNMREWAQRVGRRMIQHLSLKPPYGAGFEFDARLRPSGNSGVLVTTLQAFASYQHDEAQTWEHQALCRARAISPLSDAKKQVNHVVLQTLHHDVAEQALKNDVRSMRNKMFEHLSSKVKTCINIKQDDGGLVDIEFLAQYARLWFKIDETSTVATFNQLPAHAAARWHEVAPLLVQRFVEYRQLENALRVHLWASVARLPADDSAKEWETLRRHTSIASVESLKENMHDVHQIFTELLG